MLVGYARCSTQKQDLRAQKDALRALGVSDDRIYVDEGLTGANRVRPGLALALAACHPGDTLIVTKLDRLARSISDARDIADELTAREVKLSFAGQVYDPCDPMGKLVFNMMSVFAEFEADLIRMRTREGMRIAKEDGKLRGKQPKLSPKQEAQLVKLYDSGDYSKSELAEMFGVARSTVGRAVDRARVNQA
jgi:DNA invertase Pin-like site-specific DNA recombinase